MKNAYPSYQEFHMHQPFFSFDVKQYEEQVQTTPYTARFYQFSTHKIIDRSQNQDLFMVCIPDAAWMWSSFSTTSNSNWNSLVLRSPESR